MKEAELRIRLDLDHPLDKSIYDYVSELGPAEQKRDFLIQSIILNMKIPQMYQLFYLRNLFSQLPVGNSFPAMQPTEISMGAKMDLGVNKQEVPIIAQPTVTKQRIIDKQVDKKDSLGLIISLKDTFRL